jgi:hypothetical protein
LRRPLDEEEEGFMKAKLCLLGALALLVGLSPTDARAAKKLLPKPQVGILAFGTMFGVDGAFVGEEHPIRGVVGDEFAWEIDSAVGRLSLDGRLTIRVRGLVFKDDPSVPAELRGINDEDEFRGLVSCLDEDASVVNVVSRGFHATRSGNSLIDDHLELPPTCVAPIVFVLAGGEDKWFAVTGVEAED